MNIIDLATKTMQTAIKGVVDSIKTVTDATKVKVDSIEANVNTLVNGRVVKSVQKGSVYIASTALTTHTATFSAINENKAIVIVNGSKTSAGTETTITLKSLSSTSLTVEAGNHGGTGNISCSWQIIEYY